jgi:prepilin-type N-terminal cleavage/methylation domain-containing protein
MERLKVQSSKFKVASFLTWNLKLGTRNCRRRRAFTLTELMIVIAIMAILAGLGLSAMAGATNLAREHRTGAQIGKIDLLIMEKWEGYRTRSVPIRLGTNVTMQPNGARIAAVLRLNAIRDLTRMELPDRITDVVDPPANLSFAYPLIQPPVTMPKPALQKTYQRLAMRFTNSANLSALSNNWTTENEGAECLYLILSAMKDGDKAALDYFDSSEIGDTDNGGQGDGMPEILDGWGQPIQFLRWAPGYLSTAAASVATMQDSQNPNVPPWVAAPDPFDPARADPRWLLNVTPKPFALYPLIYSAGPDKQYDIAAKLTDPLVSGQFHYVNTTPMCDPYFTPTNGELPAGTPKDQNGDGANFGDNITNHSLATQK